MPFVEKNQKQKSTELKKTTKKIKNQEKKIVFSFSVPEENRYITNVNNFKLWMKASKEQVQQHIQKSIPENGKYERLCRGEKLKIQVILIHLKRER